jgi:phage-related protein
MASHTLGTIRGTIEIDYDGAGIVRAVRDTDKAKKSLGGLDGASSKVLSAFGKFAKGAVVTAGAVNLLTNGVHLLVGFLATVGPIAAAAFATAPAIILGVASALVITQVALLGVGDALKAAGGDAAKFDEALKKLSPNAQAFARAFRTALPQLTAVKNAIQDAFFKGAPGAVATVVARVASLKAQAAGVAFAIGQIAQNIVKTATNSVNIEKLRLILSGVNAFLLQIKQSLGPVVTGFVGLGAQAAQFGGVVGGVLAKAISQFAIFLNNIDLAQLFATALPIIKSVAGFFADVGRIAVQVFKVFTTEGGSAVGVLGQLADQLANFLESAQGQQLIVSLGQALQAISTGAGQVFLALLQALAPAIVALAPGVAQLAGQIAGVLVPALAFLAPALENIAQFLSENMSWIGPLAIAVVGLAAAYKTYAAIAGVVESIQVFMAKDIVINTAAWIGNTAALIASKVAQGAIAASMAVVRAATLAWTAVQWALNVALDANPIGLVVLAIAALVAGIILLWKNSETFRTIVLAVWSAIRTAIGAVASWFTGTIVPSLKRAVDQIVAAFKFLFSVQQSIWNLIIAVIRGAISFIRSAITAGANAVRSIWSSVFNGIVAVTRAVMNSIVSVIRSQINAAKNVIAGIKVVVTTVRNAFNSAKSAAASALSSLVSTVRGIPGRVVGALGNLGRLLYGRGQQLIRGFINGIGSMIGAVRDKVSSVVSAVTRFLPGSPAKEGPLSGKGYVLLRARRFMADFAQGIADGSQKPSAALLGAVNPVARVVVPAGSGTKSGASSTPSTPPATGGTREYNISIGDKTFAKLVVDAITGEPIAMAKVVKEGDRQGSFAGSGRK